MVVALATDIGDVPGAATRFVVIDRRPASDPGPVVPRQSLLGTPDAAVTPTTASAASARTVLACFPPGQRPDRLWEVLAPFVERGIELLRFESRPTRAALGACYFLLECVGDVVEPALAAALHALHGRGVGVTLLGVLPRHPGQVTPPILLMEPV